MKFSRPLPEELEAFLTPRQRRSKWEFSKAADSDCDYRSVYIPV